MATLNTVKSVIRHTKGPDGYYPVSEWTLAEDIQMNNGTSLTDYTRTFVNVTTTFNEDGSIEELDRTTNEKKKTVFNADGSISQTIYNSSNVIIGTITFVFNEDGSITQTYTKN